VTGPKKTQATATAQAQDQTQKRTTAPDTSQIGDLVVGVATARLGELDRSLTGEHLLLTLRITNLSDKAVTYHSWSQPETRVVLRDQHKNYYNRIPARAQTDILISPGRTVTDTLTFEAPLGRADLELDLTLPGDDKSFLFRIPAVSLVRVQPSITYKVARFTASPPPPPEPSPAPAASPTPEIDQRLVSSILRDHRDGIKKIEQRAMGMGFDRSSNYRREGKAKLLTALGKKYKMTVEEIRQLIPGE
jgi:hypothetical protein